MDWNAFLKNLIESIGFSDYSVDFDAEHHHGRIYLHENQEFIKENLPTLVESLNHLLQLIARQRGEQPVFVDVNNYRREREGLIVELARAAARKVAATKQEIALPAMNSYERRLAHLELSTRPDIETESFGKGRGRYVVIRPLGEKREATPPATAAVGSETPSKEPAER